MAEKLQVTIEEELKKSYLDYAMSVIIGRALPDVRDGLKPVHRRILIAMYELSNTYQRPYKKSARIVGDVIGKYHPHGDVAVYDSLVRMAQDFSMRYVLVDGQGNFGSVDGDPAAAMRYTEVRMSKMTDFLLADLEKETVDFSPNYDGTELIPDVLPTQLPNLLINGASGIAVGMATNIPPHHLGEIIDACLAILDRPDLSFAELLTIVPGPDFPTAASIYGTSGIVQAYQTGRGKVELRAKTHIETQKGGRESIVVTELPYQVNKARLLERIAELVKEDKLHGIHALRDESDKDGMRMVIEIKRDDNAEVVLNHLYKQTVLHTTFGVNMVALVNGRPETLSLRQILDCFLQHRASVVTRRTLYELHRARTRAQLLAGFAVARAHLDRIIEMIRSAIDPQAARMALVEATFRCDEISELLARAESAGVANYGQDGVYQLSIEQAQAILDLRLQRLTGLEQDKIQQEFLDLLEAIAGWQAILADRDKLKAVIYDELLLLKKEFTDKRKTEIITDTSFISDEDLIANDQVALTYSAAGYIKTQSLDQYVSQRRGGRGRAAANIKSTDVIKELLICQMHDTLLCFTSSGRLHWLKVYQLPSSLRQARGKPINNLIPLSDHERVQAMLPLTNLQQAGFILLITEKGTVKKVAITEFSRPRMGGIIGIDLDGDDALVAAGLWLPDSDVMLFSSDGKCVRFGFEQVRSMGRGARGVRGMRLSKSAKVVSAVFVRDDDKQILLTTVNGYGKRTKISDFPRHSRGGQGVRSINTAKRNGALVAVALVQEQDEILMISKLANMVRIKACEVGLTGRSAQGVRLINLNVGDSVSAIQCIQDEADLGVDDV